MDHAGRQLNAERIAEDTGAGFAIAVEDVRKVAMLLGVVEMLHLVIANRSMSRRRDRPVAYADQTTELHPNQIEDIIGPNMALGARRRLIVWRVGCDCL